MDLGVLAATYINIYLNQGAVLNADGAVIVTVKSYLGFACIVVLESNAPALRHCAVNKLKIAVLTDAHKAPVAGKVGCKIHIYTTARQEQ